MNENQTMANALGETESADHEAGHFVAGYLLKLTYVVYNVSIEEGTAPGTGVPTGGGVAADHKLLSSPEQWGIYSMAGMAAKRIGLRRRYGHHIARQLEPFIRSGGAGDIKGLPLVPGTREDWGPYMSKAHGLLERHWYLVEALSRELLEHKTLYHEEAWLFVRAIEANQPFILDYLKAYRRFRREAAQDTIPKMFLEAQPGLTWFETFASFREREGCPDLAKFYEWYSEKMGLAGDPGEKKEESAAVDLPDLIRAWDLPKLLASAVVDIATARIKARVKSLLSR
jgi:hypothetical protein